MIREVLSNFCFGGQLFILFRASTDTKSVGQFCPIILYCICQPRINLSLAKSLSYGPLMSFMFQVDKGYLFGSVVR